MKRTGEQHNLAKMFQQEKQQQCISNSKHDRRVDDDSAKEEFRKLQAISESVIKETKLLVESSNGGEEPNLSESWDRQRFNLLEQLQQQCDQELSSSQAKFIDDCGIRSESCHDDIYSHDLSNRLMTQEHSADYAPSSNMRTPPKHSTQQTRHENMYTTTDIVKLESDLPSSSGDHPALFSRNQSLTNVNDSAVVGIGGAPWKRKADDTQQYQTTGTGFDIPRKCTLFPPHHYFSLSFAHTFCFACSSHSRQESGIEIARV